MERVHTLIKALPTATIPQADLMIYELQTLIGNQLIRYVSHHFGNNGVEFIEEVVQRTWIKIWEKASQCHSSTSSSTYAWIYKIARNTALTLWRDMKKLDEVISFDDVVFTEAAPQDLPTIHGSSRKGHIIKSERAIEEEIVEQEYQRSWKAFLSPKERQVYGLWIAGYTKSEIADILKMKRPRVSEYFRQIINKKLSFNG